jgi:hypothetical protein
MKRDLEYYTRSSSRVGINTTFLGICFSLFTFIVAINSEILKDNLLLTLELTVAIPLFLGSIFARNRLAYTKKPIIWNNLGGTMFNLGYGFLISVIGMLISSLVSIKISMLFFLLNLIITLTYSFFAYTEEKNNSRIIKDSFFLAITFIFGVLPSLGVWNI